MRAPILVDTDVVIDFSRGDATAARTLAHLEAEHSIALSVVTKMELLVGCRNKTELQQLVRFLARYEIIDTEVSIVSIAAAMIEEYALSHGLQIPDALIAATAIALEIPLVTKNQRDYKFIHQLFLLPYPQ